MSQATFAAPSKRKRVEDTTEPSIEPVKTRSTEIWLEDGNIVIEAEGTQFKVLRSILAAQSSVFKDMFSFPQPVIFVEKTTVEGCPVVHLSDSAADVTIVLKAMFLRGLTTHEQLD